MDKQQLFDNATDTKSYETQATDAADLRPNGEECSELEPPSPSVQLTRREILTIFCVYVGIFFGASVSSLQAPLYPTMADTKGVTHLDTGIVFGSYSICIFIVPPIAGIMVSRTSTKFVMTTGCFILSVTTLLFGFLQWSPPLSTFLSLSIVLRIFEGTGMSFFLNASYIYLSVHFPALFAPLVAGLELIFAVAACVGPVLGGLLDDVGGFVTPFATVGAMTLLSGFFILFLFKEKPHASDDDDRPVAMLAPLKHVGVLLHMLLNLVAFSFLGFNLTTLTYYLHEVDTSITSSYVGLIFFANAVTLGTATQLTGHVITKMKRPYLISYLGLFLIALGYLFIGPMWPMEIKPSIWSIVVSELVMGMGYGLLEISALTLCFLEAYAAGFPQSKATKTVVSSLFVSGVGLGYAVGSFSGGALYEAFGYQKATTFVVGYTILNFLILFAFTLSKRRLSVPYERENITDL